MSANIITPSDILSTAVDGLEVDLVTAAFSPST